MSPHSTPLEQVVEGAARGAEAVEELVEVTIALGVVAVLVGGMAAVVAHSSRRFRASSFPSSCPSCQAAPPIAYVAHGDPDSVAADRPLWGRLLSILR